MPERRLAKYDAQLSALIKCVFVFTFCDKESMSFKGDILHSIVFERFITNLEIIRKRYEIFFGVRLKNNID